MQECLKALLWPYTFLICINDLVEEGIKSEVKFFADDTLLFSIVQTQYHG